jgi:sigma-B regulation protein RsbU (phosphoserine phosphatase)
MFFETHLRTLLHLDGHVNEVALELNRADGSTLPVLVNAVLDRSADGGPGITRVAVFDATERRHYEQELLAAKRRAEASEQRSADLARTLQDTLMPPRHPTITGMDVATAYRPAGEGDEIGGDFYDVFEVADHDWVVALGDVAGKGVAAAVVATLARHTIRAVAVSEASPAEILRQLNQVILHHPTERFCTAVVLRMRRVGATWDALMSTGGHPPAIVLDDDLRTIGSPAHLIGVFEDAEYEDLRFEMPPGTTVLLHTDGITDGRRDRELYGEERLMRLLRRNTDPTDVLVARILEDVLRFQDGNARDDIALVALHVPEGRS